MLDKLARLHTSFGKTDEQSTEMATFLINCWRSGGISATSRLACHFRKRLVKIGNPMNEYGIFSKDEPRINNLSQLRSAYTSHSLVSGHIVFGLQCLLPGRHELIIQCRDPVKRLMSGLLRKYIKFDHSGMFLNCTNQGTLESTLKKTLCR